MTITILYVILVICTCALLCVGIAMYMRVRRLARASDTQFCRAVKDVAEPTNDQQEHNAAAATEAAQ
ncbi:MAG TPA: hypothetical protein VFA71_01420 [Terriglobales bacterium]|nr:hypothetical protein [Terriglobales bacterium]